MQYRLRTLLDCPAPQLIGMVVALALVFVLLIVMLCQFAWGINTFGEMEQDDPNTPNIPWSGS